MTYGKVIIKVYFFGNFNVAFISGILYTIFYSNATVKNETKLLKSKIRHCKF